MRPEEVLLRLGGVGTAGQVVPVTGRHAVRRAVKAGSVVRDAHGRYALPGADEARRAGNRLSAVVSHRSAARLLGWEVKLPPEQPQVLIPRTRKVAPARRDGIHVRWADLAPEDRAGGTTAPVRTVLDCAKDEDFDEALAVADSALRHGDVTRDQLLHAAQRLPARHRRRCLRVCQAADGRAENPFESALRAHSLDVPGLRLEPQVTVVETGGLTVRPDLVDVERRIVVEADSFAWHGGREDLARDCRRYNLLALKGWLVLRFSWEDVMFSADYVRDCLTVAVRERPVGHAVAPVVRRGAA